MSKNSVDPAAQDDRRAVVERLKAHLTDVSDGRRA